MNLRTIIQTKPFIANTTENCVLKCDIIVQ